MPSLWPKSAITPNAILEGVANFNRELVGNSGESILEGEEHSVDVVTIENR